MTGFELLPSWLGQPGVGPSEALGAMLVIAAMGVLSAPTLVKALRARSEAGPSSPMGAR